MAYRTRHSDRHIDSQNMCSQQKITRKSQYNNVSAGKNQFFDSKLTKKGIKVIRERSIGMEDGWKKQNLRLIEKTHEY